MKPFGLHAMVKEAACLAKCMCVYRVIGFVVDVDKSLPDNVIGDEKRVFQVILHMVGNAINGNHGGGVLVFRVFAETGSQGRNDQGWTAWRPSSSSGDVNIRFEIGRFLWATNMTPYKFFSSRKLRCELGSKF